MRLTSYTEYKKFDADTELTEAQVNYYADICSGAIELYLDRDLGQSTINEYHNSFGDNVIYLNQWPIDTVYMVCYAFDTYGQISLNDGDKKNIQIHNDLTTLKVIYDFGSIETLFTIADYDTFTELIDDIVTDIEDNTDYTVTTSIASTYATISPKYLSAATYTEFSNRGICEFQGYDIKNTIKYEKKEYSLILSTKIKTGDNSILVKYKYGYEDVDALPVMIVDTCNRMIKDIENSDANDDSLTSKYNKEKLGNAEYFKYNREEVIKDTYVGGILSKYKDQLERYTRKELYIN